MHKSITGPLITSVMTPSRAELWTRKEMTGPTRRRGPCHFLHPQGLTSASRCDTLLKCDRTACLSVTSSSCSDSTLRHASVEVEKEALSPNDGCRPTISQRHRSQYNYLIGASESKHHWIVCQNEGFIKEQKLSVIETNVTHNWFAEFFLFFSPHRYHGSYCMM